MMMKIPLLADLVDEILLLQRESVMAQLWFCPLAGDGGGVGDDDDDYDHDHDDDDDEYDDGDDDDDYYDDNDDHLLADLPSLLSGRLAPFTARRARRRPPTTSGDHDHDYDDDVHHHDGDVDRGDVDHGDVDHGIHLYLYISVYICICIFICKSTCCIEYMVCLLMNISPLIKVTPWKREWTRKAEKNQKFIFKNIKTYENIYKPNTTEKKIKILTS